MPEYRSPEEWRDQAAAIDRINTILDQAVHDSASTLAAIHFQEMPGVVDLWTDKVWDGLRNGLSPENRVQALLLLLDDRIQAERDALIYAVTNFTSEETS